MSFGIKIVSFYLLLCSCNGGHVRNKANIHPQEEAYLAALYEAETQGIADDYIVVLQPGTNVANHLKGIHPLLTPEDKILDSFTIQRLTGYGAILTKKTLDKLRTNKEVQYIEQNTIPETESCAQQNSAPWGLIRTSARDLPMGSKYKYRSTGEDVVIYVIDTGIDVAHKDFEGRASWGYDFVNPKPQDTSHQKPYSDHGTHVAGIAISKTYGMAKKAKAIALKYYTTRDVIEAIEFAVKNYTNNANPKKRRAVINMSFTVSQVDNALNTAVDDAIDKGLVAIAAAGNDNVDACGVSPASASKLITVMNSQMDDTRQCTSNFGKCCHLYAPGTDILSTLPDNKSGKLTGTSMAAPHVVGVVARYLSSFPPDQQPTPAEVKRWLLVSALPKINDSGKLYPLLHYEDCISRSTLVKNL